MATGILYVKEMFRAVEIKKGLEYYCVPARFLRLREEIQKTAFGILFMQPCGSLEYNMAVVLWCVMEDQRHVLLNQLPHTVFNRSEMFALRTAYATYCNEAAIQFETQYVDSEVLTFEIN